MTSYRPIRNPDLFVKTKQDVFQAGGIIKLKSTYTATYIQSY